MSNIRKKTSIILTFVATLFLSLALIFSNIGATKAKAAESPVFALKQNASIVKTDDYAGIKWETKINKQYLNDCKAIGSDIEFGLLAIPSVLVDGVEDLKTDTAKALKIEANNEAIRKTLENSQEENKEISYFSILNYKNIVTAYGQLNESDPANYPMTDAEQIKQAAYSLNITVRPYVIIDGVASYPETAENSVSIRVLAVNTIVAGNSTEDEKQNALEYVGGVMPVKASGESVYNLLQIDAPQSIVINELSGKTVTEVAFNDTSVKYSFNGTTIMVESDLSSFSVQDVNYVYVFTTNGVIYQEIKFKNIISTTEEFIKVFALKADVENPADYPVIKGEYVLANDIDFFGATLSEFSYKAGVGVAPAEESVGVGFAGTLDGQGHAIKNLVAPNGGIFGIICGTIKNVAFIDCDVKADATLSGILAKSVTKPAHFENVYLRYSGEYSSNKRLFTRQLSLHYSLTNCYFEGDLSFARAMHLNTNTDYAYQEGLTSKASNSVIVVSNQALGAVWGSKNYVIEGKLDGSSSNLPMYGGVQATAIKLTLKDNVYRQESAASLKANPVAWSLVQSSFANNDNFVVDANTGLIAWKNNYDLCVDGKAIAGSKLDFVYNEKAELSVKDALGNEVSGITFSLEESNAIGLNGNVLEATAEGTNTLIVKKDGKVMFVVKVNATLPITDLTNIYTLYATEQGAKFDANLFGGTPSSIYNFDSESDATFTLESGVVKFENAVVGKTYKVVLRYADRLVYVNAVCVTKFITTADEFISTFALAKGDATEATNLAELATFDGYYVLGNDIDLAGKEFTEKFTKVVDIWDEGINYEFKTAENWDKVGLTGTFDGNGYSVKNMVAPEGGLFGVINGTVKNVAFINADCVLGASGKNGILAKQINSNTENKIENVYISSSAEHVAKKTLLAAAVDYDMPIENCYIVGNQILMGGTTQDVAKNNRFGVALSLDGNARNVVLVSKYFLGSQNDAGSHKNGPFDANESGSTSTTALDQNGTALTTSPIRAEGSIYRYESVEELAAMYNTNDIVKGVVDKFAQNGYYTVKDNKIAWKNSYTLYADDGLVTDYTFNVVIGQNTKLTVKDAFGDVVEGFNFVLEGTGVCAVEGNYIKGVTAGKENLTLAKDGKNFFTIKVVSDLSKIDLTEEIVLVIDDAGATLTDDRLLAATIVGAETDGANVHIDASNKLTMTGAEGGKTYIVDLKYADKIIQISVKYYTKIITTTDEFIEIFNLAKTGTDASDLASLNKFAGYYILANDLDFTGKTLRSTFSYDGAGTAYVADGVDSTAFGLTGTLDGQGYAIKNLVAPNGGIFGTISGAVKNVAFINVDVNNASVNSGILGKFAFATAEISNVYLKTSNTEYTSLKQMLTTYGYRDISIKDSYFEGEMNFMRALTSGTTYYANTLTNANNSAIIVSKYVLSSQSGYFVASGDGNADGSSTVLPLSNKGTRAVAAFVNNSTTYINSRANGQVYRYNTVEEMATYYANNTYAKELIDTFKANDNFKFIKGNLMWHSESATLVYNEKGESIDSATIYVNSKSADQIASISVTAGLTNGIYGLGLADGVKLEVVSGDAYVNIDGLTIAAKAEGTAEINVIHNDVVVKKLTINVLEGYEASDVVLDVEQTGTDKGVIAGSDIKAIFGDENAVITSAKETSGKIDVVVSNNKLTFYPAGDSENEFVNNKGESFDVVLATSTQRIMVKIAPVTKIIRTADDLAVFTLTDNETTSSYSNGVDDDIANLKTFAGYYILGNDIDASTFTGNKRFYVSNIFNYDVANKGLVGTFDGRGYSIKNYTAKRGGMFGVINGTVKNVAFENITHELRLGTTFGDSFPIAYLLASTGTMENVYIKPATSTLANDAPMFSRTIGSIKTDAVMKNVYIDTYNTIMGRPVNSANSNYHYSKDAFANFENVVVRSEKAFSDYGNNHGWDVQNVTTSKASSYVGFYTLANETVRRFESIADIKTWYDKADNTSAKSVIDALVNTGYFLYNAENGQVAWKSYAVYADANKVENGAVALSIGKSATLSVKDSLGATQTGYTYELKAASSAISLNGAVITANADGEAVVLVKKNGVVEFEVTVTVAKETVDLSASYTALVDVDGEELDTAKIGGAPTGASTDAEGVTAKIVSGKLVLEGATVNTTYDVTVETAAQYTKIKATHYTAVIKTAEEFVSTFDLVKDGTTSDHPVNLNTFGGYYVLANNIDFAGKTMPTDTLTSANGSYNTSKANWDFFDADVLGMVGLTGTFDGRGYAIKNIVAPEGGLFGAISGTIKNVAFINADVNTPDRMSGILAKQVYGSATLENVYLKVADTCEYSSNKQMVAPYVAYGAKINNSYFEGNMHLIYIPTWNGNGSVLGYAGSAAGYALTANTNSYIVVSKYVLGMYQGNYDNVVEGIVDNGYTTTAQGISFNGVTYPISAKTKYMAGKVYRYGAASEMIGNTVSSVVTTAMTNTGYFTYNSTTGVVGWAK